MATVEEQIQIHIEEVNQAKLPEDLRGKVITRLNQLLSLATSPTFLPEYDRMTRYIEWIISLPWMERTEDQLDLTKAREVLDSNHHGLTEIKDRVLEYLSVMKLKRQQNAETDVFRAPILCFQGLAGTGKTTIAYSIAEAMGRKIARIPFGGMGDALELRGQSRMNAEAEPGKVIKALRATGSKNCVILLDEIDRVTDQGRSSIMGVLVELLDPGQNHEYVDHYIDFPFDLSEVLFIATTNNMQNISTAVLDRLEPIQMPSYSDLEKVTIAKDYMLPKILENAGLPLDSLQVDPDTWALLVRPMGFDAGMRTMQRTLESVVRRVAMMRVQGNLQPFHITKDNVRAILAS